MFAISAMAISISATLTTSVDKNYVKFDNNLYAARFEVTNKQYREFLGNLKSENKTAEYIKCMYDSAQWTKKFPSANNKPMVYHSHPAYDNYPVVNISFEAAKLYCNWLTIQYNRNSKRTYHQVIFRLPTENEWEKLSAPLPGHNLPWYGNFPYTDERAKTFLTNIKMKDVIGGNDDYYSDGGIMTIIVGHYKPNNIGIYDVIGNVCEMTSDGKLKGGSWDNYIDECTVDKSQTYPLPDPRVGFRTIMEVIEK